MADYITFEEAASLLNVSHSTLYRWLREDRVPGHKVGRQWRFVRGELEAFMLDDGSEKAAALQPLIDFIFNTNQETPMQNVQSPAQLASSLLWNAVDHGARVIHFQPVGAGHTLHYRTSEGLDEMVELAEGALDSLDEEWRGWSKPVRNEDNRRLFLEREVDGEPQRLQVGYQKIETLVGARLTLRLLQEEGTKLTIDDVAFDDDAARLRELCKESHGLVLLAGRSGSGKTTTAYVCLSEIAGDSNRVVFTIEETAGYLIPGINQIEIDLDDARAYRRTFSAIFDSDLDVLFISSSFSKRHRSLLWNTALNAAESGHLVFVQMEAESAEDAHKKFCDTIDRPADDYLLATCWQELDSDEEGKRFARYQWK